MPLGAFELLIVLSVPLTAVLMIVSAVRRFRNRPANDEGPLRWKRIKDVVGYLVFGILLLICWLVVMVGILLNFVS